MNQLDKVLIKTEKDPSMLYKRAGTTNDVKKSAFLTRNAELRFIGKIIYIPSLIKKCFEKWVFEQSDFDYKALVMLANVHN